MDVFLTVDVETYGGNYEHDVHGLGKGLDYILDQCAKHGVRATFFVEALGATQWGTDGLRRACRMILDAGQDVQLHVHPVLADIPGFEDREDVLWKHDAAVQRRLIGTGLDVLRECGVPRPCAFRAGDLAADERTLDAMAAEKLYIGSNRDLDLKCSIRTRLNDRFPVRNDVSRLGRIVDLPVTALRSPLPFLDGPQRHFEISALSALEMTGGLVRMSRAGYSCATILTHPGEFFRLSRRGADAIGKNCRRLERLMAFLKRRGDMRVLTVGECAAKSTIPESSPPEVWLNPVFSVVRVLEQARGRIQAFRHRRRG